jgi:spermidine synthase
VIKTLVDEVKFTGKITGVEIDEAVIKIASMYFELDQIPNVEIVIDDAFEYVLKTKKTYDLIIIDIFQDTTMPNFLFEDFFINRINSLLNLNGFILFNTMVISKLQEDRNLLYKSKFKGNYSLRMYPKVDVHNELFTIKKLA